MNRTSFAAVCLSSCLLCASGCVSLFANGVLIERQDPPPLFAGVRADSEEIKNAVTEPPSFKNLFGGLLLALDLPLSAAMDTLLIPRNMIEMYKHKQNVNAITESHEGPTETNLPEPATTDNNDAADKSQVGPRNETRAEREE